MSAADPVTTAHLKQRSAPAAVQAVGWLRLLLAHAAAWWVVIGLQTSAEFTDAVRRGIDPALWANLHGNVLSHLPWMGLTCGLDLWLRLRPQPLGVARVARAYLGAAAMFLLPYQVYFSYFFIPLEGEVWSPGSALASVPAIYWFKNLTFFSGAFAVVVALAVSRQRQHAEAERQRVESDNLSLRLELEHQRLATLQAQLEPHFLFNALNAISAMVRGAQKAQALSAIAELSELLRYALQASRSERVQLQEEFVFLRRYLGLQALRFGERLQSTVELPSSLDHADCPPLLLQPLVENAIRHGIEPSADTGWVSVRAQASPDGVDLVVENSLPGTAATPGLGLGHSLVHERLRRIAGARFTVSRMTDRYRAGVHLPFAGG